MGPGTATLVGAVAPEGCGMPAPGLVPLDGARRLYGLSRDIYAPVLLAFAARCLDDLRDDPRSINLCLGRDGISAFLAQHALLRLAPRGDGGLDPARVRLIYLSRGLLAAAGTSAARRRLLDAYLRAYGLGRGGRITLIDVGIHGVIQDTLQRLYPDQSLRGEYLILSHPRGERARATKRGFLVERGGGARVGALDGVAGAARVRGDSAFLRRDAIHLLEDLWSGVYESVTALRVDTASGRARPVFRGLGTLSRLPVPAAEVVRLKRVALRGVVDGVTLAARRAVNVAGGGNLGGLVGVRSAAATAPAIARLAAWIATTRDPASPDAWLWETLIRGAGSAGGGDDLDSS